MNTEALHNYLSGVANKPFRLGHLDCVRFVSEALYVGFDRDHRAKLDYWDRRSAVVRLRRAGGLRRAMTTALGPELVPADLQVGDIAYFETPHPAIGLVMPDYVAVKQGHTIHRVARFAILGGWRS